MPSTVYVYFDRINIRSRHHLLEVTQHVGGDLARADFVDQVPAIFFFHRRIATENVVFLWMTGLLANHPVRDHDVSKGISWTPGIVSTIENWFVEDEIHHRVGNIANLLHGLTLLAGQAFNNASSDEFGSSHDDRLGSNRLQFAAEHVCHLYLFSLRNHGHDGRPGQHPIAVFGLQDLR